MPPLKYFAPNSLTAASLVLGLASVVLSSRGHYELAAWMILWGTLLDKVDGSVARLVDASSEFGVQFDSFADFVSFGVAPAALIYFRVSEASPLPGLVAAICALYAVALAVRLARFNITTGGETIFLGIPGTMMGGVVASAFLTVTKHGASDAVIAWFPALLAVGAIAMVSHVRIPKLKASKNKAWNAFQLGNVLVAYVTTALRLVPEYPLVLGLLYLIGGIAYCQMHPELGMPAPAKAGTAGPDERLAA